LKIYTFEEIDEFACQIENKETTETKEILMLQDNSGTSVAHCLGRNSDKTKWKTFDKEILMLQNSDKTSVAHLLAYWHPTWITDDIEVLSFYSRDWGETVEDTLVKKNKM